MMTEVTRPLVVMPAKAGIHSQRPVIMDSGFRRNDSQSGLVIPLVKMEP
jgi:hypothetical protein